ncbi:MAG: hypothetical protein HQK91_00135 [Nitrospirae bacterium]|nr:hypothetical protein [Nitrospirota bacterium]MBF0539845.1 hypothetical protein [Nitrospirota bacterium]
MAKDFTNSFNELVALATKFVESQKGTWDHYAWLDFISEVQKKGFDITDDLQDQLGSVTESMKKCYNAIGDTKGFQNILGEISQSSIEFVKKNKGVWNNDGWESYIKDLQKKGLALNDMTQSYAGNILESVKSLYSFIPVAGKPAKTAAK